MNNRSCSCIRLVITRASAIPMRASQSLRIDLVPLKIPRHCFAQCQRQLLYAPGRRTCDIKFLVAPSLTLRFPNPTPVDPPIRWRSRSFRLFAFNSASPPNEVSAGDAFARKLYVFAHGVWSGKSARMLFSVALHTPRSVINPVTKCAGVTSNP